MSHPNPRSLAFRRITRAAVILGATATITCGEAAGPDALPLALDQSAITLFEGATVLVQAVSSPGAVQWSSMDPTIAAVSTLGVVTGVSAGSTDVTATSDGQEATVAITVRIPAEIGASSLSVNFSRKIGESDPSPKTVSITNTGGDELSGLTASIDYEGTSGWLETSVGSSAPTQLNLQPRMGSLSPGTYRAAVNVEDPRASNSPLAVDVAFTVQDLGPAVISLSKSSIGFDVVHLGSNPGSQTVSVSNGGEQSLTGLSTSVSYQGSSGWLSRSLSSGSAPATLTLSASTGNLAIGEHSATVTVSSSLPGVGSKTVAVSIEVDPSFEEDIFETFSANYSGFSGTPCTGCHSSGGVSPVLSGSASAVYNGLLHDEVIPGNPGASALMCRLDGSCSSSTDMTFPTAQVNLVRAWILSGAPFN